MTQPRKPMDSASISRSDNPRINADPPAASGQPLQGQRETNAAAQQQFSSEDDGSHAGADPLRKAAYEFGWQSFLQYGRSPSTAPTSFDAVELKLKRDWEQRDGSGSGQSSWDAARAIVQDAWNKVQDAMSGTN